MRTLLPAVLLCLTGCAVGPPLRDQDLTEAYVELSTTPFFSQSKYQCGPAALATVLVANGVEVSPDELTEKIYLPELKGSLQVEIIAATRNYDRVPYILTPVLDDVLAEVVAGRPVLVMQNLLLRMWPRWHYAVVIGYDSSTDSILLRSGTHNLLRMNRVRFEATWTRADRWAMVATTTADIPHTAQPGSWLQTASAFEELGKLSLAVQSYEAAVERWPDYALGWQVLANAYYAQSDLIGAKTALSYALELQPSVAAHNNMAQVLLELGDLTEAFEHLIIAENMDESKEYTAVLAKTRLDIESHLDAAY